MTNRTDLEPIDVQLQAVSRAPLPPSADPNQTQPHDSPEASFRVVSALPAAGIKGRLAFLTTTKKLYRDDGTQWTVATDGADILANSITAAQIAAGTITAAQIAAGTITGTQIAASTITASNLNVSQLSAITADMGTLTAGKIQNAGATAGVKLSGALPGGWTRYLDLDSADTSFLKHDKLSLNYDGSAVFNGAIRSLVGGSTATAPPVQMLYSTQGENTTSTTEVSLASFSLPANAMQNNGDCIRITFACTCTGADTVKLKFGATTVFTDSSGSPGFVTVMLTRTGASTQVWIYQRTASTNLATVSNGTAGETLSGAVLIDFRAQTAIITHTVTLLLASIEYLGA